MFTPIEKILREMIALAEEREDYQSISIIKELIDTFAFSTEPKYPQELRIIGENLARDYNSTTWVNEELELWNHLI